MRKEEAKSRAVVLEMIGDLPDADVKPPSNMLFVCKVLKLPSSPRQGQPHAATFFSCMVLPSFQGHLPTSSFRGTWLSISMAELCSSGP